MPNNQIVGPMSDVMRDFINAAMDDPRRQEWQLNLLDGALKDLAGKIPQLLTDETAQFLNTMLQLEPGERNEIIIHLLAAGKYDLTPIFKLEIDTRQFTGLSCQDICALPGYIQLHAAARDMNIAVNLVGLTGEERRPPWLMVDLTKTYEDGLSTYGHPRLPEPEAERSRRKPAPGVYKL